MESFDAELQDRILFDFRWHPRPLNHLIASQIHYFLGLHLYLHLEMLRWQSIVRGHPYTPQECLDFEAISDLTNEPIYFIET